MNYEEWKTKANSLGLFHNEGTAYRYFMSIQTGRYNLAMTVLTSEFRYKNNYLDSITEIMTAEELKIYSDNTGLSIAYLSNVESDPYVSIHGVLVVNISQLFYDDGFNLDTTMINRCILELTAHVLSLEFASKKEFILSAEKKVAGVDLSTVGKLVEAYILQQFLKYAVNGMDDTDEKPFKMRISKLVGDVDDYKSRVIAAKSMLVNRRSIVSYQDLANVTDLVSFKAVINDIRFLLKLTELADVIEVV